MAATLPNAIRMPYGQEGCSDRLRFSLLLVRVEKGALWSKAGKLELDNI